MTEPLGDVPATSFLDSLGARGRWRAEPRTSIALAGAGCALAILGVLIVAGDTGATDDDFNKVPGILLSALVVGAGFFTLQSVRQGPLATAGSVAAALGVPPLMFFLTFDESGLPPYSTEGILIVSTLAWLASYAVGPGRGRPFFLGAGLIGVWFTLLQLTEKVFDAPYGVMGAFFGGYSAEASFEETGSAIGGSDAFADGSSGSFGDGGSDSFFGSDFHVPDPTTIGLLSLGLGVGYLLLTRRLDRRGHHGAATPFALATLPTLAVGIVALADDLEQAGTGLLLVVVGFALAHHGSVVGRRVTAWVGGGTTAVGGAVFMSDMTDDATIGGMLFVAAGIGLVAAGHAIAAALSEPDEMTRTVVSVSGRAAPDPADAGSAHSSPASSGPASSGPASPGPASSGPASPGPTSPVPAPPVAAPPVVPPPAVPPPPPSAPPAAHDDDQWAPPAEPPTAGSPDDDPPAPPPPPV